MKKYIPSESVLIPDTAERVFNGVIYDVFQWRQSMYDGTKSVFEMLKRPDTVTVICVTNEGILVLDEEQPNVGKRKSFPGGRVDPTDNTIIAAAAREVREETGYTFSNYRLVNVYQPHTKIEWFVNVVLAWKVKDVQLPDTDSGEKISLQFVSFADLKRLVITKSGYLGEATSIFENLKSEAELLALPEFQGIFVDR